MTKTARPKAAKPAAAAPAPCEQASAPATPKAAGKIGVIVDLLSRPEGAGIGELMQATGWQAHSVRGAVAGTLKKKLGLTVLSTKSETGRIYRIEPAQ